MLIQFQNTHEELPQQLRDRIEQKLGKLTRYTGKDDNGARVFFEVQREVGAQQTGDVWRASVNVDVGGALFHASELADSPTTAADAALKELRTEMRRAKGKERTLVRKGAGMWKSLHQRFVRGRGEQEL